MKKLKISHKAIMLFESFFIYCKRHNIDLDLDKFIEDVYICGDEDKEMDREIDNICEDLRSFRQSSCEYELQYVTLEEYEMCVDYFNK